MAMWSLRTTLVKGETRRLKANPRCQPGPTEVRLNRVCRSNLATRDFPVKFAQPCFACRKVIPVGEMARGRKRERGWDLFHPSCPLG